MYRRPVIVLGVLFLVVLTTTTVFAARMKSIEFGKGSLIAKGLLVGLGNIEGTVYLSASGLPVVTCTNQGGNQAPGQNPPRLTGDGNSELNFTQYSKNGTASFDVEADVPYKGPFTGTDAVFYGCPNGNWSAEIIEVLWDRATIKITATGDDSNVILLEEYACVTEPLPSTKVTCKQVR